MFLCHQRRLPRDEAIAAIKKAISDTYGKRGEAVVQKNYAAVDQAIANLHEVKVPETATAVFNMLPAVSSAGSAVCAQRSGHDHHRKRRHAAGQRYASGRDIPDRYGNVGETEYCERDSRLG